MAKIDVIRNKNYNFLTSTLAENEFVMVSYLSVLFKNSATYTNLHRGFLFVCCSKPCTTYQPYILYGFLQHIPTSIEVYFLSAFVQKPCNTYQPYRGVHFVCFCSEALQHIPNSIGVYFLSVLF